MSKHIAMTVNDLSVAITVLELLQQQPGIPDDLRKISETARTRLILAARQKTQSRPSAYPPEYPNSSDHLPQ